MAERKVKRIILFQSGIETLEYFTIQLQKAFLEMGYQILLFDLNKKEAEVRRIRKFFRTNETVMLTFNFQGIASEEFIYHKQYGYIWQQLKIPCFNIVVDHPMYYHDYSLFLPPDYYQISIDRYHEAYVKKYYPYIKTAGFLAHAGTKVQIEVPKDFSQRSMDVAFTGNYTSLEKCEPYFHLINEEYAAFYHKIADELIEQSKKPLEEIMWEAVRKEIGEVTNTQFAEIMNKARFIDLFLRCFVRGKTVAMLVDNGIKVHVFGDGWEDLECVHKENLIIQTEISSQECLQVLADTKIALNIMPWFRDGAHDRIFNSILNGAYCLTDHSKYLDEIFTEEEIGFFDIQHIEEIPEQIKQLLSNDASLKKKARAAYAKVEQLHTWTARAASLSKLFELYI